MEAARFDIIVEQGAPYLRKFVVLDSDGTQLDITGKLINMVMRHTPGGRVPNGKYELSTGNFYLDATDAGAFHLEILASETKLFDWFSSAYYDLLLQGFTADNEASWADATGDESIPHDGTEGTNMTDLLGEVTLTAGAGQDDCSYVGPFSGTGAEQAVRYRVKIDGTGAQDTWEWGTVDSAGTYTQVDSGLNCEVSPGTAASDLSDANGIRVLFGAITGHGGTEEWDFACIASRGGGAPNGVPVAYEVDWDLGIIYPSIDETGLSTSEKADAHAAAKYAKIYRYRDYFCPSHGPLYVDATYNPTDTAYVAGDVAVTGHLTADFRHNFLWEMQWELQVSGADQFHWRANAGGSRYAAFPHWGTYWDATYVAMTKGTAQHLMNGVYVNWNSGKTFGITSPNNALGDSWFFKTKSPLISVVNGETLATGYTHNGIYRLGMIVSNGQGLRMSGTIFGNVGKDITFADNTSDTTMRVKQVVEDIDDVSKILQGKFKVKTLITHHERYTIDRYPGFSDFLEGAW